MLCNTLTRTFAVFLAFLAATLTTPLAHADDADAVPSLNDQWDAILERHTEWGTIDGVHLVTVDYTAVSTDPAWPVLLETLAEAEEPTDLDERIAFWINVYNILAIDVVIQNYPLDSIRDAGGRIFRQIWDRDAGVVAGEMRSLNNVEHDILRNIADARLHGAVVCASVSCPPLRREAYRAETLDEQLDHNMREWLNNPKTGTLVEDDGRTLRVSRIFRFFTSDFTDEAENVWEYVRPFLDDERLSQIEAEPRIRHMSYDWSLNDSARLER